jgi:undecaprenyl-diphosphatase
MPEWVIAVDTWLFLKLNAGVANPVFDWLMPIATEVRYLMWLVVPSLAALAAFGGGKGRSTVLFALILLVSTDQLSSHIIKPLIARPRPCHNVEGARILYRCGRTFAFPSSHAVNSMGAALFFGLLYRRWLWLLIGVAVLNSYSRIYLGIHYPFDMIAGWILGGVMAWGMVRFYRHIGRPLLNRVPLFRDPGGQHASNRDPTE